MRTLVVMQARLGSTRLPAKVLLPLAGAPLLERQIERVLSARAPFELVVATTWLPEDRPIVELCERLAVASFTGHPTDLLDRHYQAARAAGAQVVLKIPSDCPLIDPQVIDTVLAFFDERCGELDYASNLHPPSWPDGNDVEVMTFAALEAAWREAGRPHERELTTPFLWDRPERFRIGNVRWAGGRDLSMSHRLTVDYPEDYALACALYEALHRPGQQPFGLDEILGLLARRPEILALNAALAGVNWYRHHLDELRTVGPEATRWPEVRA